MGQCLNNGQPNVADKTQDEQQAATQTKDTPNESATAGGDQKVYGDQGDTKKEPETKPQEETPAKQEEAKPAKQEEEKPAAPPPPLRLANLQKNRKQRRVKLKRKRTKKRSRSPKNQRPLLCHTKM